MLIKKCENLEFNKVEIEGALNVKMKMLVGPLDGSLNIAMRHFVVAPNGHTPRHIHDYEHVVKVEKNKGIFIDAIGKEHEIEEGYSLYVAPNELHQFRNPYKEDFEIICIIPVK